MLQMRHIIFTGLLATATIAPAVTIFSDNFDADAPLLNQTTFLGGWTVANGTVDVIGDPPGLPPPFNDILNGTGLYIDLDGSSGDAGVFSREFLLTAGVTYTASFQLAGSQRGSAETVDVSFGTTTASFTRASTDPFSIGTLSFTPSVDGDFLLTFENQGIPGDNVGALLDDVVVTDDVIGTGVPEPGSFALMLGGLGLLGYMARRRRKRAE